MNNRQKRGKEIAQKQDQIIRIDENHYKVNSQSRNKQHDVISTEYGWSCSCEDHFFKNICCKHIHAVEISLSIRKQVENHVTPNPIENNHCKFCNSKDIIKKGLRKNKNQQIQKYLCRNCDRYFSFNLGFEGMRATPEIITSAMQLHFTGVSLRGVQKFIKLQCVDF